MSRNSSPKPEPRAVVRLRAVVAAGLTQTELARRLNVTQQAVSSWLTCKSTPDPISMKKIRRLLGIPEAEWFLADELQKVESIVPILGRLRKAAG